MSGVVELLDSVMDRIGFECSDDVPLGWYDPP